MRGNGRPLLRAGHLGPFACLSGILTVVSPLGKRRRLARAPRDATVRYVSDRPTFRLLPQLSPESEPFWKGGERGELLVYRCRSCRRWFHPPTGACYRCRSRDVGPEPVSGRASVAAFTVNHHPWFEGFPP